MSGGGDDGYGILEASPGALAIVILFFLVVTLGFEHLLHAARKALIKRKKFGLLAALNNFASEIMLLGLASLLLGAVDRKMSSICFSTTKQPAMTPWLANVDGCACCLAKTEGVTDCFMKDRQCPVVADMAVDPICAEDKGLFKGLEHESKAVNQTSSTKEGAGSNTTSAGTNHPAGHSPGSSNHGHRRRLLAAPTEPAGGHEPTCIGRFQATYEVCGNRPGYYPIMTSDALHEVHMLLFVMAAVHIVVSALVLLLSIAKLKFYNRRAGGHKEDKLAAAAIAAAATSTHSIALATFPSNSKNVHTTAGNPSCVSAGSQGAADDSAAATSLRADPWHGRAEHMRSIKAWMIECGEQLVRQLVLFRVVTREEYSVLRASFYLSSAPFLRGMVRGKAVEDHLEDQHEHDDGHGHGTSQEAAASHPPVSLSPDQAAGSYAPYLLECVERDGARAVGLGLPMWICVLLFVLLSGVLGWATWIFMIIAAGLLLFVNTVLLASMRHMTRGGVARVQEQGWYRWLHHRHILLEVIKLILFFFTFVLSNAFYFAAFFGPKSCFFSRSGFQSLELVPWWSIMLVDICLLLNVALFTLPLYSVTTHTLKCNQKLFKSIVANKVAEGEVQGLKAMAHIADASGGPAAFNHPPAQRPHPATSV